MRVDTNTSRRALRRGRVRMTVVATVAAAMVTALPACGSSQETSSDSKEKVTPVSFQTSFFFSGWDAPFFLALDRGYYKDAGLDVTIRQGQGSADAMKTLLGGANQIVEAERTAMAIQATQTPDLLSVASIADTNGMVILSYKDANITKPKDLEGKTLAIALGSSEAGIMPQFLKANGVDLTKVKIENVSAAQKSQFLKSHKVDAISWQDFSAVGIDSLDKFNMVRLSEYGIKLLGNGLVTTPKWSKEHPEAVEAFVSATGKAWADMVKDPNPGIDALLKRTTTLKREAAMTQWEQYLNGAKVKDPEAQGKPWGYQSTSSWAAMLASAKAADVIKAPKEPNAYFSNDFVSAN